MFLVHFPIFANFILIAIGAPPTPKPPTGGVEGGTDVDIGAIAVSIDPKYPVTTCSDESQAIKCQVSDREKRLMKQLRDQHEAMGYHGYVDFLLIREGIKKMGKLDTSVDEGPDFGNEMIVAETQVTNQRIITEPVQMYVENMTIHDAGKYYCKAVWHGYYGDKSWSSPSVDIHVYDCIHLEPSNVTANVGENVTLQCVDVDVPVKWLKDGEDLDEVLNRDSAIEAPPVATKLPGIRHIFMRNDDRAGVYSCRATFEKTQQIFIKDTMMMIKTAPTPPFNIRSLQRSPTSVILHWEQFPVANKYIKAEPTFFTILYRPIEGGPFKHKTVLKIPEVMLTELKPSTVYFVRVVAENELGSSEESTRIVVTPAANEIVHVDRRLLMLMKEHLKVLDQDLRNVAVVLHNITGQDELERIMENREKEVERETTISRKDDIGGRKTGTGGAGRQSADENGPDYG